MNKAFLIFFLPRKNSCGRPWGEENLGGTCSMAFGGIDAAVFSKLLDKAYNLWLKKPRRVRDE